MSIWEAGGPEEKQCASTSEGKFWFYVGSGCKESARAINSDLLTTLTVLVFPNGNGVEGYEWPYLQYEKDYAL